MFVAVLGVDCLAPSESNVLTCDPYGLVNSAYQMHLNAAFLVVPHGAVREHRNLEVGRGFTIQAYQEVAIESGGDTGGIVVGRQQYRRVLVQIGAHKET